VSPTHVRLLAAERAELVPLLRQIAENAPLDFDRLTVLPGWSVRDVVAHCGAVLTRAGKGTMHSFSPQDNQCDVDERRSWTLAELLAELEAGYDLAASQPDAAQAALGVWIHGGDIREGLNTPGPYVHDGLPEAVTLLVERSVIRGVPPIDVTLVDAIENGLETAQVCLGDPTQEAIGWLRVDVAGLFRLVAGRRPELVERESVDVEMDSLRMFG